MKARGYRLRALGVISAILLTVGIFKLIEVRGTFAPARNVAEAGGSAIAAGIAGHRLYGRVYLEGEGDPKAPLVVVLHGDAPGINPAYQYVFASKVAKAAPGTRVVALLRPGYADPFGARSDGDRGFATGENYTPEVVGDIAAAIQELKAKLGADRVVLVGHSGGATIAANVTALNQGLVNHAFLISCPCDVPAFRLHMARLQWDPQWLIPVHSLSPSLTLDSLSGPTTITAISGANDPIALPEYAQTYVSKAAARGIQAEMIVIPGKGHEILLDPTVIDAVAGAVQSGR
jgi:pimeloyl-ACP methyl ester carboxylesterase